MSHTLYLTTTVTHCVLEEHQCHYRHHSSSLCYCRFHCYPSPCAHYTTHSLFIVHLPTTTIATTATTTTPATRPFPGKKSKAGPSKMAAAGFYYTGGEDGDAVTCFMCAKDLDGWEEGDDPMAEHEKHCPACPWMNLNLEENRFKTFFHWPHKKKHVHTVCCTHALLAPFPERQTSPVVLHRILCTYVRVSTHSMRLIRMLTK